MHKISSDILDYMCPVIRANRGHPECFASATLLQIHGQHVLVTAAHVLDDAQTSTLYIPGVRKLIELSGRGRITTSPKTGRNDDRNDTGYLLLPPDVANAAAELFSFLPVSLSDQSDIATEGKPYSFCGFPWRKQKVDHATKQIEGARYSFQGAYTFKEGFRAFGLREGIHIVTPFNIKKVQSASGQRVNALHPSGMSGGPVWAIRPIEKGSSTGTARLVGICMEYMANPGLLIGVRISGVLECIRVTSPELAAFIPPSSTLEVINTFSGNGSKDGGCNPDAPSR